MKKYEYKFVEVSAEGGWRLRQVVTPFNEKAGVYAAMGYQIIFEREL